MSDDRLDDRIRELYTELTEAAPDVPPLPVPQPARRPVWARPAALAAAGVAVVVLVLGVAAVFLTQLDADDAGDAAAPTTSAPAATAAPATTAAPAETFAPVTTSGEAADGGEPGGTPRPTERIVLLADLNRACNAAVERFNTEVPAELDGEEDFRTAFNALFEEFEVARRIAEDAAVEFGDEEAAMLADEIMRLQGSVVMGGDEPLRARYPDAVAAATELGALLAEFGATDCADLGAGLP